MTITYFHLLINHLPIIGSLLGGLVLAHGMGTKSIQTNIAAYYIFILSAVGAILAYLSGVSVNNSVDNIQVDLISIHKKFAVYALVSLIIQGVVSLIILYVIYKKISYSSLLEKTIMLLCIISFVLVARTGYLGNLIRHHDSIIKNTFEIQR